MCWAAGWLSASELVTLGASLPSACWLEVGGLGRSRWMEHLVLSCVCSPQPCRAQSGSSLSCPQIRAREMLCSLEQLFGAGCNSQRISSPEGSTSSACRGRCLQGWLPGGPQWACPRQVFCKGREQCSCGGRFLTGASCAPRQNQGRGSPANRNQRADIRRRL